MLHAAHETLADDGAHRTADEAKLERGRDERLPLQRAAHDDERVALAGLALCARQAVLVALRIFELERIERLEVRRDLLPRLRIEKELEALACREPQVMAAGRAHVQVALELGAIELSAAAGALDPQSFGNGMPPLLGADARRHQFVEPAHAA